MNIYIHVEVASRELDGKLLLAVLAASNNHDVLISDIGSFVKGLKSGVLKPGIFHTKSLTPGIKKINRHNIIAEKGFLISSMDEEGNLVKHGYDSFSILRYSEETVSQASFIFGWGSEDTDSLRRVYPEHSTRMYLTGSPRADLWSPRLSAYWSAPNRSPSRPYLLVSSNLAFINGYRKLYEIIDHDMRSGYYDRDYSLFENRFGVAEENCRLTYCFVEAIKYVSSKGNPYDIVFRPHPNEDVKAWETYLRDLPNVYVIREGSITPWVNNSFAVLHNGCTTAIESTISGKPVITYIPFDQKFASELPNELGVCVNTAEELFCVVNDLYKSRFDYGLIDCCGELPLSVSKKIYIDKNELAASKIVNAWESVSTQFAFDSNVWWRYKLVLFFHSLKSVIKMIGRSFFSFLLDAPESKNKFPPLDAKDIQSRVERLNKLLAPDSDIVCQVLSDRAVLIKKISR